ncbi:MAG: class I SAM-dependent methyltransferase [Nitrospirales bacterium]|nr:class I SAM-dependent methyltransferase [Nitrospirales bacterium]
MSDPILSRACPLCFHTDSTFLGKDQFRPYFTCRRCRLTFVPPTHYVSPNQEKSQYDFHKNSSEDQGYRTFLNQLAQPLKERLKPNCSGLDFGSGPGPTLSLILQEAGHNVSIYDWFFAYNPAVMNRFYDFITATEVVEHLHHPGFELDRLWLMVNPNGLLAVMTQLTPPGKPFLDWYYLRDPTHVCFFSSDTWDWLSLRWKAQVVYKEKNVILFRKPPEASFP